MGSLKPHSTLITLQKYSTWFIANSFRKQNRWHVFTRLTLSTASSWKDSETKISDPTTSVYDTNTTGDRAQVERSRKSRTPWLGKGRHTHTLLHVHVGVSQSQQYFQKLEGNC